MECPQTNDDGIELIIGYAAGTLDAEAENALELHLATCTGCRELVAAQRSVWSALEALKPLPVSSNFDEKLYQRIAQEQQLAWWQRWFRFEWSWRPAIPMAAACAVLVVAFLVRNSAPNVPAQSTQPKLQIEQVERALDDMDMLKQVGVEAMLEKSNERDRI